MEQYRDSQNGDSTELIDRVLIYIIYIYILCHLTLCNHVNRWIYVYIGCVDFRRLQQLNIDSY